MLKNPSILAFERKLDPSDALLYAGKWEDRQLPKQWQPIIIREKAVRGTISNRLKTEKIDPAKLDAKIENANLQKIDVATLPHDCDTLKVSFTLRVLSGTGTPSVCNNEEYQKKLHAAVKEYQTSQDDFSFLAQRYAYNLANGRFLWRNRIGVENIEVVIRHHQEHDPAQAWRFDAMKLSLRNFNTESHSEADLSALSKVIANGLSQDQYVLLDITAYVKIGAGQEVFPSQELILVKSKAKSRTLYNVNDIAAIHSQKIGNALRTIDTWYPQDSAEENVGPIAIEPYGSVTTRGKAYRQPAKEADFFSLLDKWILKNIKPSLENQHFVIANLIRGGVFGKGEKEA